MAKERNPGDAPESLTEQTTATRPTLALALAADGLSEFERFKALLRGDANKVWRFASLEWIDGCGTIILLSKKQ
jgi:hypothetical protein